MNLEGIEEILKNLKKLLKIMKSEYEPRLFGLLPPKKEFKNGLCSVVYRGQNSGKFDHMERIRMMNYLYDTKSNQAELELGEYWWPRGNYQLRKDFVVKEIEFLSNIIKLN
jgi:hypothetical protein